MKSLFPLLAVLLLVGPVARAANSSLPPPLWGDVPFEKPACVRGIHLTAWVTGNKRIRKRFEGLFAETELNTAVIDLKEVEGEVFVPGVKLDKTISVFTSAIPDLQSYLNFLKERGVFTIARIVVFSDSRLAMEKPDWAVKASSALPKALEKGFREDVWVDDRGLAWANPFNPSVWTYNIDVAVAAAQIGFQGIQFDYVRFPSDGDVKNIEFSETYTSTGAVEAIATFLQQAHERLDPLRVEMSIDVFGLAGSYSSDLGIGQKLSRLLEHVDVVSPMMYPSHYQAGEYGLESPIRAPYATVHRGVKDALRVLQGTGVSLRPYFQDFSIRKVTYTPDMVRDQIEAALDRGVGEWLLWNPSCRYTREALGPP